MSNKSLALSALDVANLNRPKLTQLRDRLFFLSSLFGILYLLASAVFFGRIIFLNDQWPTGAALFGLWAVPVTCGVTLFVWLMLRTRRVSSWSHLRTLEVILFGTLYLRLLLRSFVIMYSESMLPYVVSLLSDGKGPIATGLLAGLVYRVTMPWALFAIAYGICIPNRDRRRMLVVGAMTFTPLVVLTGACWNSEIPISSWALDVFTHGFILLFFAAVLPVRYAAARQEALERKNEHLRKKVLHLQPYKKEGLLGKGGMGTLILAEHRRLGRKVVIKQISEELSSDPNYPQYRVRFEREARCTAQLTHPSVVHIYDYDYDKKSGQPYYIMEYLDGLNIEQLMMANNGAMPPARVIHILLQLCGVLVEAEGYQHIHRDIKPRNIIVCRNRCGIHDLAKLIDFGLVREGRPNPDATNISLVRPLGTPRFMSPEHARGEELTYKADIYGLGAVAYYLLGGQQPFRQIFDHWKILAALIKGDSLEPLEEALASKYAFVTGLVMRCVDRDANRRPTAAELRESLIECRDRIGLWTTEQATQWWNDRTDKTLTPQ